jgi:hypothetical protein
LIIALPPACAGAVCGTAGNALADAPDPRRADRPRRRDKARCPHCDRPHALWWKALGRARVRSPGMSSPSRALLRLLRALPSSVTRLTASWTAAGCRHDGPARLVSVSGTTARRGRYQQHRHLTAICSKSPVSLHKSVLSFSTRNTPFATIESEVLRRPVEVTADERRYFVGQIRSAKFSPLHPVPEPSALICVHLPQQALAGT